MKKVIVFDIDDTLTEFAELYLKYALEYDKSLRGNGIIHPDNWISQAFDWNDEETLIFRQKYRSLVHKNAKIKTGAKRLLNKLKGKYDIWFLTARNKKDFDLLYDGTNQYLKKHKVPFDKLIIESNKADFLGCQENVCVFVDNDLKNLTTTHELRPEIKLYLFNTKHNLNKTTDIERVNSWKDLSNKLYHFLQNQES